MLLSYSVLVCVSLLRKAVILILISLGLVSLSLPFIKEGKVVVSLGEGSKCSVTVFLRMRRMSSRLLCRMDPVTHAKWELLVG